VALYSAHAGRLLGHRFLLLAHCGRRTGRVYRAVLEVVAWDEVASDCSAAVRPPGARARSGLGCGRARRLRTTHQAGYTCASSTCACRSVWGVIDRLSWRQTASRP